MLRGGKKSPFLGRREKLESATQLLYPRYRSLSDALLYAEGAPVPAASPVKIIPAQQIVTPVAAVSTLQAVPTPVTVTPVAAAEVVANNEESVKPKKKKQKKAKVDPLAKASGPSNAEEATHMRNVLGFSVRPPATATPCATAVDPRASNAVQSATLPAAVPQIVSQPLTTAPAAAITPASTQAVTPAVVPVQQAQQPQHAQQPQQAQQSAQPQQPQGTFKFGFASAERPAEAAPAAAQEATQPAAVAPAAAQVLPGPPEAAGTGEGFVARRVFVGGMPFSYELDAIKEYWSFCGEIEDLDVMRFPDTGRFKGIAFITYTTEEGYQEALKCDGTELDGQQLRVQKCVSAGQRASKGKKAAASSDATDAAQPAQKQPPAPKVAGYHVAYVGNLDFDATDSEVQQIFPDCNVTKVRLHTDRHTGKSRGFAHVHFLDEESIDRAMKFNGAELRGRQVKLAYAQPKKS